MKRLHSRAGMREIRERRNGAAPDSPDGVPDWRTDPEGYRRAMNRKLGFTGGKPNA